MKRLIDIACFMNCLCYFTARFSLSIKMFATYVICQCQGLTNTERRFMLNAERGDCASVAKIIEQQAALTEQGQQAVRDTSQDSLGGCGGPSNCDNILQLSC